MLFADRSDAGKQLVRIMQGFKWHHPLFLAVPRGGVEVGRILQEAFGGDLDLIITRKIGAPGQPELAIGAVSGDGGVMLNKSLAARLKVSDNYITRQTEQELAEIKRRLQVYRGKRPLPAVAGRQVVLVDDGVATGSTLLAAIEGLQEKKPAELMVAVPVGPPDTIRRLEKEVNHVFRVDAPAGFAAVGQYYLNFSQVTDEEVISVLESVWKNN